MTHPTKPARETFGEFAAGLRAKRDAAVARYAEALGDGARPVRFDGNKPGRAVIVHRSAAEPGKLQVTSFDGDVPSGHIVADDVQVAALELHRNPFLRSAAETLPTPTPRPTGARETTEAEAREYLAELDTRAARGPLSPANEHVRVQLRDALDTPSPTDAGEAGAPITSPLPLVLRSQAAILRESGMSPAIAVSLDRCAERAEELAAQLTAARTEAARLEREREEARQQLTDWEEREARVCPEDVGFEEYIAALQRQLAARDAELAGVREDAERWRYVRSRASACEVAFGGRVMFDIPFTSLCMSDPATIDAAVDTARSGAGEGQHG